MSVKERLVLCSGSRDPGHELRDAGHAREGGSSSSLLKDACRHNCVTAAQPHPWDEITSGVSHLF